MELRDGNYELFKGLMTIKDNFTIFKNVFCDSKQALEFAYKRGLSKDAIIKTSSPAMLWNKGCNVEHVEDNLSKNDIIEFHTTIQSHTEDIYNAVKNSASVTHEIALSVVWTTVQFQKILFKSACLLESDFSEACFIIQVDGSSGSLGNNMNAPWPRILANNPNLKVYTYKLENDEWDMPSMQGVSLINRIKLAGIETIFYRLGIKLMKYIPDCFFKGEVLIFGENELIIETASKLASSRYGINDMSFSDVEQKKIDIKDHSDIFNSIRPIIKRRIEKWVAPSGVLTCESIFFEDLHKQLGNFYGWCDKFESLLSDNDNVKRKKIALVNAPGNIKGQSLYFICKQKKIPVISVQHGVTAEISSKNDQISASFDSTVSDCVLVYNERSAKLQERSYFSKAVSFVSGISTRHTRVYNSLNNKLSDYPIVYISTNLYRGNLSLTGLTSDFERAKKEYNIVRNILNELPHKVCYKTYPSDNRRYADLDPILDIVKDSGNVDLYDKKTDMRYLLDKHRVFITSVATSTLSWPIMSDKPVIFINQKEDGMLSDGANKSLSKGLFLFNDYDSNFTDNLRNFLLQPIEAIEHQWHQKKKERESMVNDFFTAYKSKSGERAANFIIKQYFSC